MVARMLLYLAAKWNEGEEFMGWVRGVVHNAGVFADSIVVV